MKFEEIIVVFTTNFGNIYRSIFLLEKVDKMKFTASLVLNSIAGGIFILYEQQNPMQDWLLITCALVLGLLNQTVAAVIINFAVASEGSIGKTVSDALNEKLKQTFNVKTKSDGDSNSSD